MSIWKTGAISNYTVIRAVDLTLAELLRNEMEAPCPITITSPGDNYGTPVNPNQQTEMELGKNRVNLYLYRVEEPPHSQNNDWVNIGNGEQIPYPLSLNLHYLLNILTKEKSSNLDEHSILGDVMRVFHANPIIDPLYFEGTLDPNEPPFGMPWEELRIIHNPLTIEALSAIWHAINKPYRLSVAYEVSVVQIAPPPKKKRRVRRVDITHVKAAPFQGRPFIYDISPEQGYGGTSITIEGERLESDFLKVYLNDQEIKPETRTPETITIIVPEELPPGLYDVMVRTECGPSNTLHFEERSPFLYRLEPELKYIEEFPKNNEDKPVVTIWGGNFLTVPKEKVRLLVETKEVFIVPSNEFEHIDNNSIQWSIPDAIQEQTATLRVQIDLEQSQKRTSNALVLSFLRPQIDVVETDHITSLPWNLIIIGRFFRKGLNETELFMIPLDLEDVSESELERYKITELEIKNETEMAAIIPTEFSSGHQVDNGDYELIVRVYGVHCSNPYKINIEVNQV